MANRKFGSATKWLWLLPIVAAVSPISILVYYGGIRGELRSAAPFNLALLSLGVAVLCLLTYASRRTGDAKRPAGLTLVLAGQFAIAILSLIGDLRVSSLAMAIASALTAAGIIRLASFKIGARPSISEREILIAVSGIGLIHYVMAAQPRAENTADVVLALWNTVASVGALFAAVLAFWVISRDREAVAAPTVLTGISIAILAIQGVLLSIQANPNLTMTYASLALGLVVGAAMHPQLSETWGAAVILSSEMNERRTIVSFSVVLIGPLLVAIHLLPGLGFELHLPTVTVGSSVLSIMVAFHLLSLVRLWAAVEHQGQHDPLTNLPNRPLFFSRLGLAIDSARLRDSRFVTMFLDLDRFKAVNDTLGHEAGDELLRQVANRLHEASFRVGPDLTVARLGGDEFAIIVPQVKDARHSHAIGRLFLDQFLDPFDVGLRDIYVTPSIGIAEFPKDGGSVEELIENADTAMFEAKERGRNTVVAYSPEQRVPGAHRLEIEAALHRAIERQELELHYQPQIDITTGKIFAVESLLRWSHPTLGLISPEKFVPVAEESSLIDQIGEWIIEEACQSAARWEQIGLPPINVAVNLSPRQFQKSIHLTDIVTRSLRNSGLASDRLELELTESLALEKPEEVNQTLSRFREMGIRTAIDDFGVGHTGLDYLDRISVDTLKIDRSFINRIGESGAPLVTAVISLAKGLDLDVIAEGVETRAQVNFLASHGCRYMQGFLFSKPLSGPQLEQVLRNQMRRDASSETSGAHPQPTRGLNAEPDLFGEAAA